VRAEKVKRLLFGQGHEHLYFSIQRSAVSNQPNAGAELHRQGREERKGQKFAAEIAEGAEER
ncbi:MAG TPA: hypothetical protein VFQ41_23280, partial [Candidatus Angelobacter sp.]|nr:hypothetical protein [Candidatus Angelobacter sp.]